MSLELIIGGLGAALVAALLWGWRQWGKQSERAAQEQAQRERLTDDAHKIAAAKDEQLGAERFHPITVDDLVDGLRRPSDR